MSKKRTYGESYVLFGFTCINERDGTQMWKNSCERKPAKVKDHLTSVHSENLSKDAWFSRAKKVQFEKAGTLPKLGFAISRKPLLEASYRVAYRIAKQRKPHTIGDTLGKPCSLEMVELICGLEQRKKLEAVSLSNEVIHSRIVYMSCNMSKQIVEELAASPFPFSMHLDETTNISEFAMCMLTP
jgi:hypothetical protein